MVSTSKHLSEDIDLIKEFESLKLKQSILIESLNNKKREEDQARYLEEIHTTMQRLLDVFLQAKEYEKSKDTDESIETEGGEEGTDKLLAIADEISEINTKVSSLQDELKKLSKEMKNSQNLTITNYEKTIPTSWSGEKKNQEELKIPSTPPQTSENISTPKDSSSQTKVISEVKSN
ncbi:MAG: hypothetical protein ACLFPL_00380 [Candidatus Nanoarchaeia archaeon]